MECEKVRDRFSSLWEMELPPFEEDRVREHLSSCPECQKELEQFEKTMRWLGSVGEEEVPDGFLSELYQKMGERKGKGPEVKKEVKKSEPKGLFFPRSFKLPIQAAAMVAIVFLALYLTKMMPMEEARLQEAKESPPPVFVEKKSEPVPAQTSRPKDVDLARAPVPGEEKAKEAYVPQGQSEAKKEEALPPRTEITTHQTVASPSPHEIVLRISDREKVIPQLHELAKQFGGEIVREEGGMLLASLPIGSVSEFEKQLEGLKADAQQDKALMQKHSLGSLKAASGEKREEVDKRRREPARPITRENHTVVRILLIQE